MVRQISALAERRAVGGLSQPQGFGARLLDSTRALARELQRQPCIADRRIYP